MSENPHPSSDVYLRPEAEDPDVNRDAAEQVIDQELEDRLAAVGEDTDEAGAPVPKPGTRHPQTRRFIPFTPRRPGFTGRPNDWAKLQVVLEEQVSRQRPEWDETQVQAEVNRLYDRMKASNLRHLPLEFAQLEQTSWAPPREGLRRNIEAAAVRRLPEWKELEEQLVTCRRGRPTDRRLPLAVFLRSVLNKGDPELSKDIEHFAGSDLESDWAFMGTADMQENREHLREESVVRKVLKGMLERNDPDQCLRLNLEVLAKMGRDHEDLGRYLVVDGTPIQAWVDQTVPLTPEHAEQVVRDTGATLHYHGGGKGERARKGKWWVGWTLVVISDLKTGLPLIWRLISSGPEYAQVVPMLTELLQRAPWLDPEYLVGDSEFDTSTRLAYDLQTRLGICPVFPLRQNVGRFWEHAKTDGVPHCAKKGHGAMKLMQAEEFGAEVEPIRYEPNFAKARKDFKGRTRWACEKCADQGQKVTATTWFRKNPRLYGYLPRGGEHRLYARRVALMLRRNSIEQVFSQLKRRGIGNKHHHNCRWATKQVHMEWLCSAALFGMTARRYAHESGEYARAAEEAWALGLTKLQPATASTRTVTR